MNRVLIVVLLSVLSAIAAGKPNVLLIMSDDLNTALSGYGHADCKTPNLDRLAARGVQFSNMHCQYPLCGPSRASFMSGLYPYKNKVLTNPGSHLRKKMPVVITMSQMFRNHGYYVARVGKIYHMSIPAETRTGKSKFDDAESWDEVFNIKCDGGPGPKKDWSPGKKGSQTFMATYGTEGDSSYADGMAADKAIEVLNGMGEEKPFFLGVGFVRPHVPLIAPQKYYDLYDRAAMSIPYAPEDDLDDLPEIIRNDQTKKAYGVTTPELHRGLLEAYYASISYMDAQVGRLLDTLEANGQADNTIVIFTSDHGYHMGDHHKFQKRHLFEETTRVPFIVSVPWMTSQHGRETTKITEMIDLYPTLAEIAKLAAPKNLQGVSLLSLLKDTSSNDWKKQDAFTVSYFGGETLRTADWRFTQWGFGEDGYELYDLKNDPGEFNNVANSIDHEAVFNQLKKRLEAKRLEAGYQGKATREHAYMKKDARVREAITKGKKGRDQR